MENILDFSTIQSGGQAKSNMPCRCEICGKNWGIIGRSPQATRTISTPVSCLDGPAWADEGARVSAVVGASGNSDGLSARSNYGLY